MSAIRLAIHGGAGVIDRAHFGAEKEAAYRNALLTIMGDAWKQLVDGAAALDAVEAAVRGLEDCPYFNAGLGSVLNADGDVEMDAAVMDGSSRACGAVCAVRNVQHPVSIARAVMERTEHVLLAGAGAFRFARAEGLELADPGALITAERRIQLAAAQRAGRISLDHDEAPASEGLGTVGAVARDRDGRLAAATSTGGMTNKQPGRVGDSPLIGSGTWADNATCAVSGTGHGEYFIRAAVAYDVHARMAYGGQSVQDAAGATLDRVADLGGSGGLIAIDANGQVLLPFTTPGMYRGWVDADGIIHVAIYGGDA